MVAFGMAGFVAGLVLGLRFRILVLLPVQLTSCITASAVYIAGWASGGTAIFGALGFMILLQAGYGASLAIPTLTSRALAVKPPKKFSVF